MTPTPLINGQTVYEILQEKGLLHGLSDDALASTYATHLEQLKAFRQESAKDTGYAQIFDTLQKNDPKALAEIKRTDPAKFKRMEEAYLNGPLNAQKFEKKELTLEEAFEMFRKNDQVALEGLRRRMEELKRTDPERYNQMRQWIKSWMV